MEDRRYIRIKVLIISFFIMGVIVASVSFLMRSDIPGNAGRPLTEEEQAVIIDDNSHLAEYARLSPHADFPRKDTVRKITIHHMGGDMSLEEAGRGFAMADRKASANYGIDSSGRIGIYVEEKNRSWASSDEENDSQAVTIEVANDSEGGQWHVSDRAFDSLIMLCADICRRNGIEELVFTGGPDGNLTYHKMFSEDTECPGPYLVSRMGDIERLVNEELRGSEGEIEK